jgi:hypothetical protein
MKMIKIDNLTAEELAKQRGLLVSQIAADRVHLYEQSTSLRDSTQMIDKIILGLYFIKKHPGILLFPVAIVAALGFRRVSSLVVGGLGVLRVVQQLQTQLQQQRSTQKIV